MASNPLKTLSQALTGTPDLPSAEARAAQARKAVIDAGAAVDAAKAARTLADEAGEPGEIQKAEAALLVAERAADRASRALAIAEDKLQKAQAAVEASATTDARKRLAALLASRDKAGQAIEQALVLLEQGVKQLADTDADIAAVRTDVLGRDFVIGANCGKPALERHLAVELAQRGVQGQPSSMPFTSLADWLATGSDLLRARI